MLIFNFSIITDIGFFLFSDKLVMSFDSIKSTFSRWNGQKKAKNEKIQIAIEAGILRSQRVHMCT